LVGRDVMKKFNIGINNLTDISKRKLKMDKLLDEYKDIFSEDIGILIILKR